MEANRSKVQFLIKKDEQKKFLLQFLVIITLDPDSLEMLDPDKYPDPDPQICMIFLKLQYKIVENCRILDTGRAKQ
jgi:hypothetical protein